MVALTRVWIHELIELGRPTAHDAIEIGFELLQESVVDVAEPPDDVYAIRDLGKGCFSDVQEMQTIAPLCRPKPSAMFAATEYAAFSAES
jgi:hypothetical protein